MIRTSPDLWGSISCTSLPNQKSPDDLLDFMNT